MTGGVDHISARRGAATTCADDVTDAPFPSHPTGAGCQNDSTHDRVHGRAQLPGDVERDAGRVAVGRLAVGEEVDPVARPVEPAADAQRGLENNTRPSTVDMS